MHIRVHQHRFAITIAHKGYEIRMLIPVNKPGIHHFACNSKWNTW